MTLTALFLLAAPAFGCSIAGPQEFLIDDTLVDDQAPARPELVDVEINRGQGPRKKGLVSMSTSCDDIGFISIELEPTGEELGYYLDLVDGDLPDGMDGLPEVAWTGPGFTLTWIDEATDDQDAFAFTLSLTPVDRAGNLGDPLEVDIEDDAATKGCSSVPGAPVGSLALLAGLAGLARRRRIG